MGPQVGLLCIKMQTTHLRGATVGFGEFNWAAAVLEINLQVFPTHWFNTVKTTQHPVLCGNDIRSDHDDAPLQDTQRSEALACLEALATFCKESQGRLEELSEAVDRVLRHGETAANMSDLLEELSTQLQKEEEENNKLLAKMKTLVSAKQQACFLAWLFGVKSSEDFRPIWAARIAALQKKNPFGRYLPSFELLSAVQVGGCDLESL